MISVWFRPHYWSPGRTEEAVALQLHFDLKATLGLPEAVMTDNTITFHEPVRVGDRLKSRVDLPFDQPAGQAMNLPFRCRPGFSQFGQSLHDPSRSCFRERFAPTPLQG